MVYDIRCLYGELSEWFKVRLSKSRVQRILHRGFESLALRFGRELSENESQTKFELSRSHVDAVSECESLTSMNLQIVCEYSNEQNVKFEFSSRSTVMAEKSY